MTFSVAGLDEGRCDDRLLASMRSRDRAERLVDRFETTTVREVHEERPLRLEHVTSNAFSDSSFRCFRERFSPIEDRRNRNRPVDTLGGRAIRFSPLAVRRPRPANRLSVSTCNEEESLPGSRRAVIRRIQNSPLNCVPEMLEFMHPLAKRFAGARLDRLPVVVQWSPCHELRDILETDDPRRHGFRPWKCDRGQSTNLLGARLAALRAAEVRAVRTEMQPANHAAACGLQRIHFKNVLVMVLSLR